MLRWLLCTALALLLGLQVRTARAQDLVCPQTAHFLDLLRTRSEPVFRLVAERHATLEVSVTPNGDSYVGRMHARSPGGRRIERQVVGDSCAEVVDALAFVVVMALEADAQSAESPRPVVTARPPVPRPEARPVDRGVGGIGVLAGQMQGVAPDPGFTFALDAWHRSDLRLLPKAAAVGVLYMNSPQYVTEDATIRCRVVSGYLDIYPFGSGDPGVGVQILWGARLRGGVLFAESTGFPDGRHVLRPWGSGGIVARALWWASRRLYVEGQADVRVSFQRDRFYYEPSDTIIQTPWVGSALGLGFGLSIW